MKIYLNSQLLKFEILPSNTPTLDETLETFSFALISNTNPLPLAPMQKVKVDFLGDNTEVVDFYIVSDSVETYSLNPLRYKHNISLIQNTRELSKHLVRNSSFTQPASLFKSSFNATSGYASSYSSGAAITWTTRVPSLNWASEKLVLTDNEKVKNAKLKISFQYSINEDGTTNRVLYQNAHSPNNVLTRATVIQTLSTAPYLILNYETSGGVIVNDYIYPSDLGVTAFDLNAVYDFPIIKQKAAEGANNFEILFPSIDFLSGTFKTGSATMYPNLYFYMVQIQIEVEVYYYTCYDVLDLLLKRQRKIDDIRNDAALFTLPNSGDLYDLLTNTVAPNFTFTQATMYECVAEVFRLFDAIFTMDENGVLGIEYFNDLKRDRITPKLTGKTLSLGEDKYINCLEAYYQDARLVESFPRNGTYAPLRSAEFGVPQAQDHNLIVPHPIQSIIKCEVLLTSYNGDNGFTNGNLDVDITRFVVEQSIWSTLNNTALTNDDYTNRRVKQVDSVYYQKGDNKIQIAYSFKNSWGITTEFALYNAAHMALLRMTGSDEQDEYEPTSNMQQDWKSMKMRVTYVASVDGKVKTHTLEKKYEGEMLVDQNNGAVDLNKMGLNMLGLNIKLGNPNLNASHKITSWSDRIRVGQIYQYEGDLWVANVCNYTFVNGYIQGKISFVKNFNALALTTRMIRDKRMTNIDQQLVMKSEDVLTDFVYFSSEYPDSLGYYGESIHFTTYALTYLLADSFGFENNAYTIGDAFIYPSEPISGDYINDAIYMPLVVYGAGNTINFEMSFDQPMSAGNQTKYSTTWVGTDYFTSHVIYTDDYGFLEQTCIKIPFSHDDFDAKFPYVDIYSNVAAGTKKNHFLYIPNLKVYKQPNEIFALNYQLAFLPLPGRENIDFIGTEFINNNSLANPKKEKTQERYICFFDFECSVLDLKASDWFRKEEPSDISFGYSSGTYIMTIVYGTLTDEDIAKMKSWALVDGNNNILFAANKKLTTSITSVYFKTKLHRY